VVTPTNLQWQVVLEVDDYRKKQTKKAEPFDPAFSFFVIEYDLFLKEVLPPVHYQFNQTGAQAA
jgi:hypothetical protein